MNDVDTILETVRSYLESLPQPLKGMSLQFLYLHKDIPFIRDSILFPSWMNESFLLEKSYEYNQLLAEANVYGFLYVRLNDYIQDGFTRRGTRNGILGCLFWNKMLHNYRILFNHDSAFWFDFDQTVLEYCHAKISEYSHHVFTSFDQITDDMLQFDIQLLGKKSSLLKLCLYAYVYLGKSERELTTAISQVIDNYNAGLQLLDDIQDWKQDVEHSRINTASAYLIKRVYKNRGIECYRNLSVDELTGSASMEDFQEVYEKAISQFELARAQCQQLGFCGLEKHIEEELCEAHKRMMREKETKEKIRKAFQSKGERSHG